MGRGGDARGTRRLGARRRVGAKYRTTEELYSHCIPGMLYGEVRYVSDIPCFYFVIGQVCAHLDQGHADRTMGQDGSRPDSYCIPERADNTGQVS